MLHSMTGFARQTAESAAGAISWELRTVNHRYLDVHFRLPDVLRPKEQAFKQQIGKVLKRGKVDVALHFQPLAGSDEELQLNTGLVQLIAARAADVAASLPAAAPVDPLAVLSWPGVIVESEIDAEPLFDAATALLAQTLEQLQKMRASEGARIADMIVARCDDIASIAASVRERMPEVLEAARQRQRERIEQLDVAADPARLEVELALLAQKLDVDEEVDRLDSHLVEIRTALQSGGPVGRRLDFLMQELNREANTLGSKSADSTTTRAAVDLKVLVEQMREQIQNIE